MTVIQTNIEDEIRRLSDRLEEATGELQEKAVDSAAALVDYKRDYFKAFLLAEGSVAVREALAFDQTVDKFAILKAEEALHTSSQEACRSLRAQLSALQSLNANVRSQVGP